MWLFSDLLIFCLPSIPSTLVNSVYLAWGSTSTSPKSRLKRRTISRVNSKCGAWSTPTGTVSAL